MTPTGLKRQAHFEDVSNSSASDKFISTELNDATVKFHRIADAITHTVIAETADEILIFA